jgi:hypothetical protein
MFGLPSVFFFFFFWRILSAVAKVAIIQRIILAEFGYLLDMILFF